MSVELHDCGVIEYAAAWELQKKYFQDRIACENEPNRLLFCEHPHVYTLGKSGKEANLLINDEFLKKINASYFKIDRGGDITYHGYGQLVGYPILKISDYGIGLRQYIFNIEEAIIRTIAHYGIVGKRVNGATGVWIGEEDNERKICAIGVRASRQVTMHGFALNVSTDLKYFNYINPCGFTTRGVTSIAQELGLTLKPESDEANKLMNEVKSIFIDKFNELFIMGSSIR